MSVDKKKLQNIKLFHRAEEFFSFSEITMKTYLKITSPFIG